MVKILITGSEGYIGSHLKHLLKKQGYDIIEFDLKNMMDIREYNNLYIMFKSIPDIYAVVHLAAFIDVGESHEKALQYYENNTNSITNILKVMNIFNCKNLIFASTAAVYLHSDSKLHENSKLEPVSIYGHTKLLTEQIIQRISEINNFNYITFRFFNVAGTNPELNIKDTHNHLLPIIVKKYENEEPLKVFGNDYSTSDGTCIRDYIHVDDICNAIFLGLQKLEKEQQRTYRETINLGSGKGYSVLEIIKCFNDLVQDKNLKYVFTDRRLGDPDNLTTTNEKAFQELKWKPEKQLKDIIQSCL